MAGIKSLAVRGIRSFGPEDADEQRISFDRPLTLILGQNGCGKTSIIECLRYAITGQMPPGSRNECFVHDAKINRSTEVLAQVKLKIVNAKDKQLEVTRSMKVTALPKKKSKFQTLDSLLSVIDEDGKPKDISSRCADLDFMMREELGVSKAIINSVVFCHQEDSEWPLDEGKKVKERFDEIFDSDKYIKCFEELRKIRKEYLDNIKFLNQEVAHLTEKKQELDKKKLECVNTETRISENELKVSELTTELTPITEKINAIVTLEKNLITFETKREKIKTKLEHNKNQEQELTKAIKTLFEGTSEELQEKISTYSATAKQKKKDMDDCHKKVFSFNKEEEKTANEMSSNEAKHNKYVLLESQNQERVDNRNKMIVETAQIAELEITNVETTEEAEEGITAITEKLKGLNSDLKDQKSEADMEEKALQKAVDDSRDSLTRHKHSITSKEAEIRKLNKDITRANKEIADVHSSKAKLDSMEETMKKAEEEYDAAVAELNTEELQTEINEEEKTIETQDQEQQAITDKIMKIRKQSSTLREKEILEEQLKGKEKQFQTLQNKHRSAIVELLGSMPESNFALAVNKVESETRTEVEGVKKKLKGKDKEVTRQEADRKHVRDLLKERRAELTAAEDQLYKACGTQTYDATLAKLNGNYEKLKDEQNLLQSSLYIINKYKEQLQENNCCPLCSRGFEAQSEVTDLITDLTTKVLNVPSSLEKVNEELQRASAQKDDLIALKSVSVKCAKLKENDIPALETRLAGVDKAVADLNVTIEELNMTLIEPEKKLQTVKAMQGDMPLLDRFTNEIKTATKAFDAIVAKCVGFETDYNLEELAAEQARLKASVAALRAKVKASQKRINEHNKRIQKLADHKTKLKEQMLNIQKKVQELVNLQENLRKLEEGVERAILELKDLQDGTGALEDELKGKMDAKNDVVMRNRAAIETKRAFITTLESSFEKVKSIAKEIKQHTDKNIPRELEKVREANEKLMEKKKQLMADRDDVTKKIDALKDELSKQEIYKRDLDDNMKLRRAQTENANGERELAEIADKLSGVDADSIKEKEPLCVRQTQIFKEKATTEGRLKELKSALATHKGELQRATNKNIEGKFKEKFYELEITRALEQDMREYAVALEKSVMEFHKEKMENINLIIREMWRKIYRGNDIDYIEIKTESSMTADSDRRKYDYRVVQCKNGVEIDMRGRCSAGQKVLACLIIRLALAETFSSRFGILALDEPTTNLDQENITSLCSALAEIVQERAQQKNFMFIIITHDKEFIDSLGSVDKVTHYYDVSRNDEGKSRIKKIKFT